MARPCARYLSPSIQIHIGSYTAGGCFTSSVFGPSPTRFGAILVADTSVPVAAGNLPDGLRRGWVGGCPREPVAKACDCVVHLRNASVLSAHDNIVDGSQTRWDIPLPCVRLGCVAPTKQQFRGCLNGTRTIRMYDDLAHIADVGWHVLKLVRLPPATEVRICKGHSSSHLERCMKEK